MIVSVHVCFLLLCIYHNNFLKKDKLLDRILVGEREEEKQEEKGRRREKYLGIGVRSKKEEEIYSLPIVRILPIV